MGVITSTGFSNCKQAIDKAKGFYRHANSKEHQACMAVWKEQQLQCTTGKEISTLVNSDELSRNRLHVSVIIDIIEFLVSNELPLRGGVDFVDDRGQAGSGLFLSLFDYTLRKDKELAQAFNTIPKNAT